MAVTIEQEPAVWQTSDNPLNYVFSSDETGQPNFSFKVEIKVDLQVVYEDKVFVEVADKSHFNASPIVRYMISGPSLLAPLFADSGTTRTVQLVVTENYGDPAQDEASASSSVTNMFKASVSDREFLINDYDAEWKLQKWFTKHPTNEMVVLRTQDKSLSILGGGTLAQLQMEFFDANDVSLHSYTSANQNFNIWQLNLSADNLTTTAGVPDLSLVSYYTVQVGSSDVITVRYLDEYCWSPTAVTWVNEFGAFDSFVFQHSYVESGNVKTSSYTKQFGAWNGTTYEFVLGNSGNVDYFKRNLKKGKIATHYMSEVLQNWLVESMIGKGLGHAFYLIDGTNYPIKITANAYEKKKERWEDLISELVAFDVSFDDNSPVL